MGQTPESRPADGEAIAVPGKVSVALTVNGTAARLDVAPWTTLLDALRDHLDLTGTKKGCDHGQCGACTVLVDGRRINACLTLAVMQRRRAGRRPSRGSPPTARCTRCSRPSSSTTPSSAAIARPARSARPSACSTRSAAAAPVGDSPAPQASDDEIRERMSGNICRCGAYPNIVAAILEVHGSGA